MVVDEAGGLHQRVADRRPDEPEPSRRRSLLIARDSSVSDGIWPRPATRLTMGAPPTNDHRWSTRRRARRLERERGARAVDGGGDLRPVADDPGIGEQARDVRVVERRDGCRLEPRERLPVPVALAQDRVPRQARPGRPRGSAARTGAARPGWARPTRRRDRPASPRPGPRPRHTASRHPCAGLWLGPLTPRLSADHHPVHGDHRRRGVAMTRSSTQCSPRCGQLQAKRVARARNRRGPEIDDGDAPPST